MAKKKTLEDRFFPVPVIPKLTRIERPPENLEAIKKIIQGAVQGSYGMSLPSSYDLKYSKEKLAGMVASEEQVELVSHLIESLQPQDAIEAALASQFVITYIRGLKTSQGTHPDSLNLTLNLFEFGHKALEALQRYRSKGSQVISVQYNHNVNQGQVVNIKNVRKEDHQTTMEGAVV